MTNRASDIWKYATKDEETGCWEWQRGCSKDGTGRFKVNGRDRRVTNLAYEQSTGKSVPLGKCVGQTCKNRLCLNPEHLFIRKSMNHPNRPSDVFKNAIEMPNGCWERQSSIGANGYALFSVDGKQRRAHVVAYEEHYMTKVPKGIYVCHKCDIRHCVNPLHLFPGTHQDNMDDMVTKGRCNTPKGESSGTSKLKEYQVSEIRKLYADEDNHLTQKEIGGIYSVTQMTIGDIVHNRTWNHV